MQLTSAGCGCVASSRSAFFCLSADHTAIVRGVFAQWCVAHNLLSHTCAGIHRLDQAGSSSLRLQDPLELKAKCSQALLQNWCEALSVSMKGQHYRKEFPEMVYSCLQWHRSIGKMLPLYKMNKLGVGTCSQ